MFENHKSNALQDAGQSFLYAAAQEPATALLQIYDHMGKRTNYAEKAVLIDKPADPDSKLDWVAQQAGGALGMAFDFYLGSRLVGARCSETSTMHVVRRSAITGAVMGGLLQPVDEQAKSNFWLNRLGNAATGAAAFAVLSGTAAKSAGLVDSYKPLAQMAGGLAASVPVGLISAEGNSLSAGSGAAKVSDIGKSMASFAVGGLVLGAVDTFSPKMRTAGDAKGIDLGGTAVAEPQNLIDSGSRTDVAPQQHQIETTHAEVTEQQSSTNAASDVSRQKGEDAATAYLEAVQAKRIQPPGGRAKSWDAYKNARLVHEMDTRLAQRQELMRAGNLHGMLELTLDPNSILKESTADGSSRGLTWFAEHEAFRKANEPTYKVATDGHEVIELGSQGARLVKQPGPPWGTDYFDHPDQTWQIANTIEVSINPVDSYKTVDRSGLYVEYPVHHRNGALEPTKFSASAPNGSKFDYSTPGPWIVPAVDGTIFAKTESGAVIRFESAGKFDVRKIPGRSTSWVKTGPDLHPYNLTEVKYADGSRERHEMRTDSRTPTLSGKISITDQGERLAYEYHRDANDPQQIVRLDSQQPARWSVIRTDGTSFDQDSAGPWQVTVGNQIGHLSESRQIAKDASGNVFEQNEASVTDSWSDGYTLKGTKIPLRSPIRNPLTHTSMGARVTDSSGTVVAKGPFWGKQLPESPASRRAAWQPAVNLRNELGIDRPVMYYADPAEPNLTVLMPDGKAESWRAVRADGTQFDYNSPGPWKVTSVRSLLGTHEGSRLQRSMRDHGLNTVLSRDAEGNRALLAEPGHIIQECWIDGMVVDTSQFGKIAGFDIRTGTRWQTGHLSKLEYDQVMRMSSADRKQYWLAKLPDEEVPEMTPHLR